MVLLTIIDNKMMGVRAFLANSEVNLVPICFYLLGLRCLRVRVLLIVYPYTD